MARQNQIRRTKVSKAVVNEHPYSVGKAYFIRTVTMYYIGKLVAVYPQDAYRC